MHKWQARAQKNHVIVISYDAFSIDNWEEAKRLPNLAQLIEAGSSSNQLESIYPTLTYIIHTSYVTGMYPSKHGVYHNNPLQPFVPENEQEWFWYRHNIQTPTIFDAVHNAGLSSASLLWPVTGKAKINYNIPEIRAIKDESQMLKILRNGSPFYSVQMELKFGKLRKGIRQPYLDDFTTACAVDTILHKKPNLFTIHLIELDDIKHEKGTKGEHIQAALERMDGRIGKIVSATKKAGIFDKTTFIVIGDHGQKDVHTKIYLNRLLMEQGLIYEQNGQLHWRAYVQGAGGAAYVYVKDNDTEAKQMIDKLLRRCIQDSSLGVSQILARDSYTALKCSTHAYCMLEAKEGYCFEDDLNKPIIDCLHDRGEKYATHGYLPTLDNYTSNVVISGYKVKQQGTFGQIKVVDLAPTLAELLSITFAPCDGRVWTEVLE